MDTLYTLNDKGKWGASLQEEAKKRGWKIQTITKPGEDHDYENAIFFARIAQHFHERKKDFDIVADAAKHGATMIPDMNLLTEYESKIMQCERYPGWMPGTDFLVTPQAATQAIGKYGYPFISKSTTGSASKNVRMIDNEEAARAEIKAAFGPVGLIAPHGLGEGVQRGYVLWQKFLPGNDYDYRACIIGSKVMLLRRDNRPDVPFASGSGFTKPIAKLDDETAEVLDFSFRFFSAFDMEWSGIDIVKDHSTGEWKMLETTIGWKQSAYGKCAFFDKHGSPTGESGADIWKVFCDYIEGYR